MTDFDRDAVIEQAARSMDDQYNPDRYPIMSAMFADYAAAALPVIVAATLAPIEALHRPVPFDPAYPDARQMCEHEDVYWPCPTAQAIADIKAKAGFPDA